MSNSPKDSSNNNPWERSSRTRSAPRTSSTASESVQASVDANPTQSFHQLSLPQAQIDNLTQLGYLQMTEIQKQALPHALSGADLLAQAKTGSGKTASFGLALLDKLNPRFFGVQSLVLCPTRELATQVANELRKLARYQANIKIVVLCGGVSIGPQIGSLEHGAHVVVGTPGRIKDHLRKQTLIIDQIQTLVLDEADRMLDMGFSEDIRQIIDQTPANRQTLLFSATYPHNIEKLSRDYQTNPVTIKVTAVHQESSIDQRLVVCDRNDTEHAIERLLAHFDIQQAVVFCNTKQATEDTAYFLKKLGFVARAIHGDMEQRDRDQVLTQFKQGSTNFLVATDVAARGLDVDDLPAVINVELPRDMEVYTHRIGRTGRAGKEGIALSLISPREDHKRDTLNQQQQTRIPVMALSELSSDPVHPQKPDVVTLCLAAGRKHKLRPGDILGALTAKGGINGSDVGKINVLDFVAYVAVNQSVANDAIRILNMGKVKGRTIKARKI